MDPASGSILVTVKSGNQHAEASYVQMNLKPTKFLNVWAHLTWPTIAVDHYQLFHNLSTIQLPYDLWILDQLTSFQLNKLSNIYIFFDKKQKISYFLIRNRIYHMISNIVNNFSKPLLPSIESSHIFSSQTHYSLIFKDLFWWLGQLKHVLK